MGSLGRERELQQWMEVEPHTQQVRAADSEPSDRRLGLGLDLHLQFELDIVSTCMQLLPA